MPIPSFTGYDTALRGLEAEQVAIDTTGQNIDNASTPGYSQEAVTLNESDPLIIQADSNVTGNGVDLGTGVDATTITRVRNQFLDVQYRAQNTVLGAANANLTSLQQAQAAFDEPTSNGLSAQMSQFFNDWSSLANSTTSASSGLAAAQTLVSDATSLAQQFNSLSSQLSTIQTQAGQQLASITGTNGTLEQDADQIAQLNGEIANQLAAGQSPNTLEDQRDSLIDSLSSLGSVSVTDPGNGLLQITFGGSSTPLIDGTTVNWPPPAPTTATGGEIGALAGLADTSAAGTLSPYLSQLDTVANNLITSVNSITDAATSSNPYNFFTGNSASTIAVNPAITASSITTTGDNSVPLAVSEIPGTAADTADSSYDALVAGIGAAVQAATSQQANAQSLVTAIENQRESVSGVSVDEQMTNLLAYQQGYQAAARVLNTMDDVLNTLINDTGVQ